MKHEPECKCSECELARFNKKKPLVKRVAQASLFRMMVGTMADDPTKALELFPWLPEVLQVDLEPTDLSCRTIRALKEIVQ